MADQSLISLQKVNRREKASNIAIGFSKSVVNEGNKVGFSGNHDSHKLKKMDSTRILGSEMNGDKKDNKRRCFEKLVVRRERMTEQNVEDVKCALEVEVVDDTALIEAAAAVTAFKNRNRNENDVGFGNNPRNTGGSRNPKQDNDGKKKRNKGSKKQGKGCSTKCVNEKKTDSQVVQDHKTATEKKISEGKSHIVFRKLSGKAKAVYQRKDTKGPKVEATSAGEHQKVENQNEPKKIISEAIQETDKDANMSNGNDKELIIKLVEAETVDENDDGLKLNPKTDAHTKNNEAEDQNVDENTTVGSKKFAYSREEIEAFRFMDEQGQKAKWTEVYSGFSPSVAREYKWLATDGNNRQTQRYTRVVNCGSTSTRHANAILSMPPVLPLCSPYNYRKFEPYDRVGYRVNFN